MYSPGNSVFTTGNIPFPLNFGFKIMSPPQQECSNASGAMQRVFNCEVFNVTSRAHLSKLSKHVLAVNGAGAFSG